MSATMGFGRTKQRGDALIVVLVMLVAMAWFALSGFRLTGQHLQIVGNSQVRQHALASAQRAIEETISSFQFALNPAVVAATPLSTDVDGDGRVDYTAVLAPPPKCYRVRPVKTAELDVSKATDRVCLQSTGPPGTQLIEQPSLPVAAGDSLCSATEWNISAQVADADSSARVAIQQGVAIRVGKSDAATYCK